MGRALDRPSRRKVRSRCLCAAGGYLDVFWEQRPVAQMGMCGSPVASYSFTFGEIPRSSIQTNLGLRWRVNVILHLLFPLPSTLRESAALLHRNGYVSDSMIKLYPRVLSTVGNLSNRRSPNQTPFDRGGGAEV